MRAPPGFDARRHLYRRRERRSRWRYEHLWPYAVAWSGVAALASLPGVPERVGHTLEGFLVGAAAYGPGRRPTSGFASAVVPPLGRGGDRYYDDNAWLGLAALRHAEASRAPGALGVAHSAYSFVRSGWNEGARCALGGVRWRDTSTSRSSHACSTGPAAQLGTLLYLRSGDAAALDWARDAYAWMRRHLLGGEGLYFDRIDPHGSVEKSVWSYNQGTMIGAGALLHEATGDRAFLSDAQDLAAVAAARFGLAGLVRQSAAFNAIYLRNAFLLAAHVQAPNDALFDVAAAYGEHLWVALDESRGPEGRWSFLRPATTPTLEITGPCVEVFSLLAGAVPRA